VAVNLVDERLKVGGNAATCGGRLSDRRIAFALAIEHDQEDPVAERRVRVGGHART
jgi:hypothetical protein